MLQYNENDLIVYKNGELVGVAVADIATPIGNEIDLIELKDVNTGDKLNGDCFIWDAVNQEWTNRKLTFEDVTGFKLGSGDETGDLLSWNNANKKWTATNPERYLNLYKETETLVGSWTEGQDLHRKVIELDLPLIANVEKTIYVDQLKGYPIESILFTRVEGFYIAEDGIARYSSLGQMKVRLIPGMVEIKLTSIANHIPHIWLILEYVKPYTPGTSGWRVWSDEFDQSYQNNP